MKILQFFRFFTAYEKYITFFLLCVALICSSWSLVIPGLNEGHDLLHQARIFEMATGLKEGVFPVIWSQNLTYGYGMPLFEFYAPIPYFIGALFHLIGFNLTLSVELLIFVISVLTLCGGYLLSYELFKNKYAATLSAAALTLAPYRAVDLLIRLALSESFAIAVLPFVLLGGVKIIRNKKSGFVLLTISFAALILSHNLTALFSVPFIAIFLLSFIFIENKTWRERAISVGKLFIYSLVGVGISAFYFIPALLEKNHTQIDKYILSSYFDFHQHFLYIRQFIKPWGLWEYGGSGWGPNDEMSYFLGYSQLLILALSFLITCYAVYKSIKNKRADKNLYSLLLIQFLVFLSLFLTLLKVQKIWELAHFMAYIQFPWRLLTMTITFGSLLFGSVYVHIKKRYQQLYFFITILVLFIFNTRYFQSEKYRDYSPLFSNYQETVRTVTSSVLYDYIPIEINFLHLVGFYIYKNPVYVNVDVPAKSLFSNQFLSTYHPKILIEESTRKIFTVTTDTPTSVSLNLAYYPGWSVWIDDIPTPVTVNENGLISFLLPSGEHYVKVRLIDTPIRWWSKIISLICVFITLFLAIFFYKKKRK